MLELNTDQNLLEIQVGNSRNVVGVYYRMPTMPEMQKYRSAVLRVKGNKVAFRVKDSTIKYRFGLALFTGMGQVDVAGIPPFPNAFRMTRDQVGCLRFDRIAVRHLDCGL